MENGLGMLSVSFFLVSAVSSSSSVLSSRSMHTFGLEEDFFLMLCFAIVLHNDKAYYDSFRSNLFRKRSLVLQTANQGQNDVSI